MPKARLAAPIALTIAVMAGCGGDGGADRPPRLVQELRAGGHVIVMRHALTETATDEQESLRSCAAQRNLSDEGRRQARRIGEAVQQLAIPIGDVRASPMCRTRETAELAFGRATTDRTLVSPGVVGTIEDDDRRARKLRRLVAERPRQNLVVVTHTGNIGALGESVVEGEMLVYAGGRLVDRVRPQDWSALAGGAGPPG